MKRTLSIILSLCLLLTGAALFTGCSSDSAKDWPVTVNDVTIEKEPENIVVLNDTFADIISYIGYDVKMVGRSAECDQKFLHVVPTMGTAAAPDEAAITAAAADLVIADNTLGADAKSNLEADGIKVITFEKPANEEQLKQLYIDLGTALGGKTTGSEKGENGYDSLIEMLGTMNTATSNVVQTVAYLYLDESGQLCTFVKDTLEYKFFNYNGNSNVFSNQTEPVVNPQELRIGSPNYIFYDTDAVLAYLAANTEFANLNALKDNRTCQIPKKAFERYGTSAEQAVFDMLNFIDKDSKGTPDEASADEINSTVPAGMSQAPVSETAAAPAETAAPAAEADAAEADDGNVITYSFEE